MRDDAFPWMLSVCHKLVFFLSLGLYGLPCPPTKESRETDDTIETCVSLRPHAILRHRSVARSQASSAFRAKPIKISAYPARAPQTLRNAIPLRGTQGGGINNSESIKNYPGAQPLSVSLHRRLERGTSELRAQNRKNKQSAQSS